MTREKTNSVQEFSSSVDDKFPMLKALHADGPAADRAEQMMLYGQFVGSWDGQILAQSFHVDSNAEVFSTVAIEMKQRSKSILAGHYKVKLSRMFGLRLHVI